MRVRSRRGPVVTDPCLEGGLGEVEDYTVNIGVLGVNDYEISNSDFVVTTLGNNKFDVSLKTSFDGGVYLGVYNTLGQEVAFNKAVSKEGDAYKVTLDMSKMSSGVYLLKMGGQGTTSYKTGRIIVK